MASSNFTYFKPEAINEYEDMFSKKLFNELLIMELIEDANLKKLALDYIPIDELNIEATRRLSLVEEDACLEDCLLLQLLQWFKLSFFTWVDKPACQKCGNKTENRGTVAPTSDELKWFASTIEHFYCSICNLFIRFPRYHHPKKLLETRKGRCGEWAICFALFCRSLEFDTRLVVDWTDHVWIEFFSPFKQKWVHCDPCENICDQPLVYEMGWKKKLTYVIAFSKDEVQDVTWRYTCNFNDVLLRRKATNCRETFVLDCIHYYTNRCQSKKTSIEVNALRKRQLFELAEFLLPPKIPDDNLSGRISGSKAWRLARGEIGIEDSHIPYIFNLNATEIKQKHFHIQYSCAINEYIRVSDNSVRSENWTSLIFEAKDIFRKIETDWKMSYLARIEGSPTGLVKWKFDFEKSGLVIQTLRINLQCTTFENGEVKWYISAIKPSGKSAEKIFVGEVLSLESEEFKGAIGLTITAELTAGSGKQAWQHAQLFRQSLTSKDFPFEVEIFLDELQT